MTNPPSCGGCCCTVFIALIIATLMIIGLIGGK